MDREPSEIDEKGSQESTSKKGVQSVELSYLKSLILEEKEFQAKRDPSSRPNLGSTEKSSYFRDNLVPSQADATKIVKEILEKKAASDSIILFKKSSSWTHSVSILKELLNSGRLKPECLPVLGISLPTQLGPTLESPSLMKKTLHAMLLECDNQRRTFVKMFLK